MCGTCLPRERQYLLVPTLLLLDLEALLDEDKDVVELSLGGVVGNVVLLRDDGDTLRLEDGLAGGLVRGGDNLVLRAVAPEDGGLGVGVGHLGALGDPAGEHDAAAERSLLVGRDGGVREDGALREAADDDAVGGDAVGDELLDLRVDRRDGGGDAGVVVLRLGGARPVGEDVEPSGVALAIVLRDGLRGGGGADDAALTLAEGHLAGEVLGGTLPVLGGAAEAVEEDDRGVAVGGAVSGNLGVAGVGEGDDGAERLALMHEVEGLVDLGVGEELGEELVDKRGAALEVGLDVLRELRAAAAAAKGAAGPRLAGDELEGLGGDLGAGGGDADDAALAPALVGALERAAHELSGADALEGVVEAGAVGLPDGALDSVLRGDVLGVDEVGEAKLAGLRLLRVVEVNADNLGGARLLEAHHNGEADAAEAEDGSGRARLDLHRVVDGAVAGRHAASQETDALEGGLLRDLRDGHLGDDGVLGEGGAAHKVEDLNLLAVLDGREAAGAVEHDAQVLRLVGGGAEVGLLREAVLAAAALANVEGDDVVTDGNGGDALADALNDTSALVAEDDGEALNIGAFGLAGGGEGAGLGPVGVADARAEDLDADLAGLGGLDLDGLLDEVGAVRPLDHSEAGDLLTDGGHGWVCAWGWVGGGCL